MVNRSEFLTVANMKECKAVFTQFMMDVYSIDVSEDERLLRKVLYDVMKEVDRRHGADHNKSLKKLNNISLNMARDAFLPPDDEEDENDTKGKKTGKQQRQQQRPMTPQVSSSHRGPNVQVLERDRQVYGNRPIPLPPLSDRPQMADTVDQQSLDTSFERILAERDGKEKSAQEHGSAAAARALANATGMPPDPRMTEEECAQELAYRMQNRGEYEDARDQQDDVHVSMGRDDVEAGREVVNTILDVDDDEDDGRTDTHHTDERAVSTMRRTELRDLPFPPQLNDQDQAFTYTQTQGTDPDRQANLAYAAAPSSSSTSPYMQHPRGANAQQSPIVVDPSDFIVKDETVHKGSIVKFLSVNGFDRNWMREPYRYQYTVNTANGSLNTSFRDIVAIQATNVIIPLDIMNGGGGEGGVPGDRSTFVHEFGFPYPYSILCIDGFEGVYDGTNDAVRRGFCKFTYKKEFKSRNGRGFVILEPMQEEIKRFEPTPLATLRNLSISLLKPNGTLFNQSRDDYVLEKIEYEAFNRFYLKVVVNKYFDKNEFYVGDTVLFRNAKFQRPDDLEEQDMARLREMEQFINRDEGHDIIELGGSNESGFYRTFHIYAPGAFDPEQGMLLIAEELIDALVAHNNSEETDGGVMESGNLINSSLQNVITFRIWMQQAFMSPDAVQHLRPLPPN